MAEGSFGGALAGAAAGGLGGRAGWNIYQQNRKGLSSFGRMRQRLSAKVGRQITRGAPSIAQGYGPQITKPRTFTSGRSGGSITEDMLMGGHARNMGGKRLGGQIVGAGMMAGAGFGAGIAYGVGSSLAGSLGNTFGNQMRTSYGNAFSGMGNGRAAGY